jgi:hypothetical protein
MEKVATRIARNTKFGEHGKLNPTAVHLVEHINNGGSVGLNIGNPHRRNTGSDSEKSVMHLLISMVKSAIDRR